MTPLWLPTRPLLSSDEAAALEDLTTHPPAPTDPWEAPAMAASGPRPRVHLDEVMFLLRAGDTIETVARTLGVSEESIVTVGRRKGTPEQQARIRLATEEMRDIRLGLAS